VCKVFRSCINRWTGHVYEQKAATVAPVRVRVAPLSHSEPPNQHQFNEVGNVQAFARHCSSVSRRDMDHDLKPAVYLRTLSLSGVFIYGTLGHIEPFRGERRASISVASSMDCSHNLLPAGHTRIAALKCAQNVLGHNTLPYVRGQGVFSRASVAGQ
jgi:hypothetical protein